MVNSTLDVILGISTVSNTHAVHPGLDLLFLGTVPSAAVVEVVPVLLVRSKQSCPYSLGVDLVGADRAFPAVLEAALVLCDEAAYQ